MNNPGLILAGPGTGKTTYLIQKTADLLKSIKDKNEGILICTFTRKATEELTSRIYSQCPIEEINRTNFIIGTIHSICYDLLSRYSSKDFGDYQILPEESQVHFIHSKLKNLGYSNDRVKKNGWLLAEDLTTIFNKINDEEINIDNIDFKENYELEDACRVYSTYRRLLIKNRLFDYASIQSTFLKELENDEDFKTQILSEFKYFLVDEYQDVNLLQHKIFLKLTEPSFNLTVVGDDDQSIYAFRGASVEHLRNFNSFFEKRDIRVTEKILNVNYRSTSEVVNFTNSILDNATYPRIEKNISANRVGTGHVPVIKEFETDVEEATFIGDSIKRLLSEGIVSSYSQIALLFRSVKNHGGKIIEYFEAQGIPYQLIGAGNFFESTIGQEFMALVDYYLARDIEKEIIFFDRLARIDVDNRSDLTSIYSTQNIIENLEKLFEKKAYNSCIDLAYDLLIGTRMFNRYEAEGHNLGKITDLALTFDDFSSQFDPWGFYSYLSYLSSSHNIDYVSSLNLDENRVKLMTIHQSKGLEYPVVFLPSQIERSKRTSIVEKLNKLIGNPVRNQSEETRVLYVGCTRTEDLLVLSGSRSLSNTSKRYEMNSDVKKLLNNTGFESVINFDLLANQDFRVKSINSEEHLILSYNKIRLYDSCPRAYMYSHVWNLQTVRIGGMEYGRNMHKIIETLLRKILDGELLQTIDLDNLVDDNWNNTTFRSEEENEKFKNSARKQFKKFVVNCKDLLNINNVFSVEDQFNVLVNSNLVTGRFDGVFEDDQSIKIVDFKTGDKADYSSQLSFYSLCFKEKYPTEKEIQIGVYFLKDAELEWLTPNPAKEEVLKIESIADNIKKGDYTPTPGLVCHNCAFNNICEFSK